MSRRPGCLRHAAAVLFLVAAAAAPPRALAPQRAAPAEPVAIPFELATRHMIVGVTVNGSRPLSFVLDTGANVAIIRTDVAKSLGLTLDGQVTAGGAGEGRQTGSFVKGARWSLAGLDGFSQPITLALPLPELPAAFGRPLDGIIGGEFIRQFVVEIDYQARRLRLHQPASFDYRGPGEAIPIEFSNVTHPVIPATVTPTGGAPIERRFLFDLGSGAALVLHSPFVAEQKLPGPGVKTIRAIGAAGAGGRTTGQLGRVASLQIGSFTLEQPVTLFSNDRAGAFANASLAGNVGAQIGMRFRLFLDYGRRRIIFEPSPLFGMPFDRAFSGFALRAQGDDYRTYRVVDVLENSPATEAGIQEGDVLTAIDDVPAERLSLSAINEMLEKPVRYTLTLRRGPVTITVSLTPRKMI